MRGINYLAFRCSRETQQILNKEISITYKHISLMHKRLRYQVKTHEISEKLNTRKNNFCTGSPFYIYIYILLKIKHTSKKKKTTTTTTTKHMLSRDED
jgi:DNA replication protein DnaD